MNQDFTDLNRLFELLDALGQPPSFMPRANLRGFLFHDSGALAFYERGREVQKQCEARRDFARAAKLVHADKCRLARTLGAPLPAPLDKQVLAAARAKMPTRPKKPTSRITLARIAAGVTIDSVARRCGLQPSTWHLIEKRGGARPATAELAGKYLHVPPVMLHLRFDQIAARLDNENEFFDFLREFPR
jgi:hypothetical protein